MAKCTFIIILVFFLATVTISTLSPSNKKQQKNKENSETTKMVGRSVFDRGLVVKDVKKVDILQQSALNFQDTKRRNFNGEVLGYVTPWNREGAEVVKRFHGKLTLVSPTWLTLPSGNATKFEIATHDIQENWLKDVRDANNENHSVRVLPRLLFENWSAEEIMSFHIDDERRAQLISVLAKTANRFKFQGYVLEIWTGFVYSGVTMGIIVNCVKSLCEGLKKENLEVILVIPPFRTSDAEIFSRAHFNALSPAVDFFSLMTYDFSSVQRPGPNSPLEWIRKCIKKLVPQDNDPRRRQILMGLNFYGYNYNPQGGTAILGLQYVKLVEALKGKINWDDKSKEHFFQLKTNIGTSYVFYPTLYSLQYRIDLATEMGVGISIWELGQGLNYFYDLL